MKGFDPILRDVSLHSEARSLRRPAKVANRVVTISVPRETAVENQLQHSQAPAREGGLVPTTEKTRTVLPSAELEHEEVKRQMEEARIFGYQQAVREEGAKWQQEAERRAARLAQELSEERVREAMVSAERKVLEANERLQSELVAQRDACARLMRSVSSEIEQRLKESEDDILVLAFAMVNRVLGVNAVTQEGLRLQIEQALQNWHLSSAPEIHLHPDDVAWIQADARWLSALDGAASDSVAAVPRLVPDAEVRVGGCILRSADGELDARLEFQIEAMKAALVQTRNARRVGVNHVDGGDRT